MVIVFADLNQMDSLHLMGLNTFSHNEGKTDPYDMVEFYSTSITGGVTKFRTEKMPSSGPCPELISYNDQVQTSVCVAYSAS